MNANSALQMPAIKDWLTLASNKLTDIGISSAKLDAEIILSLTLNRDRTYLHAHPEQIIDSIQCNAANSKLEERLNRVPIAYITGHKDFYGRSFSVSKGTLIPRPESEDIITLLEKIINTNYKNLNNLHLVDIGTGTGCLGITAKLEFPQIDVTLLDISTEAVKVAKSNADSLSASVEALDSDLLQKYTLNPDIILANLPYVDRNWKRSPETDFEPELALFTDDNGTFLIKKLLAQASKKINDDGIILIEADPVQHKDLIKSAKTNSFQLIDKLRYILAFKKSGN